MLSIEDCTKDSHYETTLERLRVRLEELELWEDYIMKQQPKHSRRGVSGKDGNFSADDGKPKEGEIIMIIETENGYAWKEEGFLPMVIVGINAANDINGNKKYKVFLKCSDRPR